MLERCADGCLCAGQLFGCPLLVGLELGEGLVESGDPVLESGDDAMPAPWVSWGPAGRCGPATRISVLVVELAHHRVDLLQLDLCRLAQVRLVDLVVLRVQAVHLLG